MNEENFDQIDARDLVKDAALTHLDNVVDGDAEKLIKDEVTPALKEALKNAEFEIEIPTEEGSVTLQNPIHLEDLDTNIPEHLGEGAATQDAYRLALKMMEGEIAVEAIGATEDIQNVIDNVVANQVDAAMGNGDPIEAAQVNAEGLVEVKELIEGKLPKNLEDAVLEDVVERIEKGTRDLVDDLSVPVEYVELSPEAEERRQALMAMVADNAMKDQEANVAADNFMEKLASVLKDGNPLDDVDGVESKNKGDQSPPVRDDDHDKGAGGRDV